MISSLRSRRNFLELSGLGLAAGGVWSGMARAAVVGRDPEYVVLNAKVYTVDDRMPQAQAFAVRGGRFLAVGGNDEVRALAGPGTKTIDAGQKTVVPGFIDCHNHARGNTLLYDVLVGNPFEVEFVTIDSIIGKLRERAAQTPAGSWVEGYFYDDVKVRDNRLLTADDLDKVSTEHPVAVYHRGGHTSFYNHRALQLAGITSDTPNPPGGTFDRDDKGNLNGRVTDRARSVFANVGTRPTYTPEQAERRDIEGLAHISKQFVRYGLTTVHHQGGNLFALQQLRNRGDLLHRVSFEVSGDLLEAMIANGIRTGFGDDWIRLGATSEHTLDGSFSERTMALSFPYAGSNPPYYGNVTEGQDVLDAWTERVHRAGIQVNCHANGDVVIDSMLKAFERAQRLFPVADARPKITHCTYINDDLIRRIKAAGAVPALFSTYIYYNSDKFAFYGEDFLQRAMAYRTMVDAGIPVAVGTDFSPGPFSPLMAIQGMVTRTGWDGKTWGANQRVSVAEAIRINTLNGAYAAFEEQVKGSITPGKFADYVLLAEDPHSADPETIKDIRILETVTGGRTVYSV